MKHLKKNVSCIFRNCWLCNGSHTDKKISANNNAFFDAHVKTKLNNKKVCVMLNSTTRRKMFTDKCEVKSPVKLIGLSSPPKGTIVFFNSNTGSRLEELKTIDFSNMKEKK